MPMRSRQKSGAQVRGDVLQTVVASHAATLLEPDLAGRQVELVVHHQYLRWRDLVELARAPEPPDRSGS